MLLAGVAYACRMAALRFRAFTSELARNTYEDESLGCRTAEQTLALIPHCCAAARFGAVACGATPQTGNRAPAFRREIPARRRSRLSSVLPGKRRPEHRPLHRHHESDAQVRGSSALSHRGRAVDHCERKCFHRNGRDEGYRARSRRLRHDAQQGPALVHVHRQRRMPDVRHLRPRLRHRVAQANQIAPPWSAAVWPAALTASTLPPPVQTTPPRPFPRLLFPLAVTWPFLATRRNPVTSAPARICGPGKIGTESANHLRL